MTAARTSKPRPAGKRRPTRPVIDDAADEGDLGYEPLRFSTDGPEPEVEMVPLFSIDDVEYRIPKQIPPYVGLRFLWDMRRIGEERAAAALLEDVIGEEAYQALMAYKRLTATDLENLMRVVQRVALGAVDQHPKGRGSG